MATGQNALMDIQLEARRVHDNKGRTQPGVVVEAPRYFYFPTGDYEAAIAALLEAGFVEGGVRPQYRKR